MYVRLREEPVLCVAHTVSHTLPTRNERSDVPEHHIYIEGWLLREGCCFVYLFEWQSWRGFGLWGSSVSSAPSRPPSGQTGSRRWRAAAPVATARTAPATRQEDGLQNRTGAPPLSDPMFHCTKWRPDTRLLHPYSTFKVPKPKSLYHQIQTMNNYISTLY